MNDQNQDAGNKISARRRLVRGVFAAPAALTLFSGSVAARSLNNCVTKQLNSAVIPPVTTTQGTTFVRVQLKRFTGSYNGTLRTNRFSRWVKGTDVVALQATGTLAPYLSASQWQLFDRGTTDVRSCGTSTFNPASKYLGTSVGTIISLLPDESGAVQCSNTAEIRTIVGAGPDVDEWVALRVNANGDILGVAGISGQSTSGTSAVYQSCWTSFRIG